MDMIRLLQIIVLLFGLKELYSAVTYFKQKRVEWAAASSCVGILACGCALISITGIL